MNGSGDAGEPPILGVHAILIGEIRPAPLSPSQFQELQEALEYESVFFQSPFCMRYDDALAEFLKQLSMTVVSDIHTSFSRTCWLSGTINSSPVLAVLDSVKGQVTSLVTLDVWSDCRGIAIAFQNRLSVSAFAEVAQSSANIEFDWELGPELEFPHQLIVSFSSRLPTNAPKENWCVSVSCSGLESEEVTLSVPLDGGIASVSIEPDWSSQTEVVSLDSLFFAVVIRDASWKPLATSVKCNVLWRDALEKQIQRKLMTKSRFESFHELSRYLGFSPYAPADSAMNLFFDYCFEKTTQSCEKSRTEDYCQRLAILTGLVTCFNPARGLSGYLELVSGESSPVSVRSLGGRRTWRNDISEVANVANEFRPTPLSLVRSKRGNHRGRPPTHLVPTVPLIQLFRRFMVEPEVYICGNCRFAG